MKITFLGTASGKPSKFRNVSSAFVEFEGKNILVDGGEGTQHQFLKTNIRPNRIDTIIITHLHGDHIYGIPGLLSTMSVEKRLDPVDIIAPSGFKQFLLTCFQTTRTNLNFNINFIEISEEVISLTKNISIKPIKLNHDIQSYGFLFTETKRNISMSKLKEFNLSPGPILGKLQNGPVEHEGKEISFDMISDKTVKKYLICGDNNIKKTSEIYQYANDLELLVHESTILGLEGDNDIDAHTNFDNLYNFIQNRNIKNLVCNHLSFRYTKKDTDFKLSSLKKPQTKIYFAEDLSEFKF